MLNVCVLYLELPGSVGLSFCGHIYNMPLWERAERESACAGLGSASDLPSSRCASLDLVSPVVCRELLVGVVLRRSLSPRAEFREELLRSLSTVSFRANSL